MPYTMYWTGRRRQRAWRKRRRRRFSQLCLPPLAFFTSLQVWCVIYHAPSYLPFIPTYRLRLSNGHAFAFGTTPPPHFPHCPLLPSPPTYLPATIAGYIHDPPLIYQVAFYPAHFCICHAHTPAFACLAFLHPQTGGLGVWRGVAWRGAGLHLLPACTPFPLCLSPNVCKAPGTGIIWERRREEGAGRSLWRRTVENSGTRLGHTFQAVEAHTDSPHLPPLLPPSPCPSHQTPRAWRRGRLGGADGGFHKPLYSYSLSLPILFRIQDLH